MSDESIIGKFFGVLGFKVDHHGVEDFQKSLDHVKHAVQGIFAVELIGHVVEFVERSIGAAAAVNDLAEVTEMSAEKIAALGRVAIDNSSNVDAMKEAILGVYRATGQAAMGIGRNVKLFQALGLHAKDSSGHVKSAETMMGEIADKFQKMDMAKVVATAGRLGIDPMIAKAMKEMGAEGWEKAVGEALGKGLLTEEDYRQADKTEKTFKRFHLITGQIAALLANQLAPWLRRAVDAIEKFITENKVEIVKKMHAGMRLLSRVLSEIWQVGASVYKAMAKVYEFFQKNERAGQALRAVFVALVGLRVAAWIRGVADSLAALRSSALLSLAPLALLVGGVVLIVQDWMAFKRGEESVFQSLSEKWPGAIKAIETAIRAVKEIWDAIVEDARELGLLSKAPPPKAGTPEFAQAISRSDALQAEVEEKATNPLGVGKQPWYKGVAAHFLRGGIYDMQQTANALDILQKARDAKAAADAVEPGGSSQLFGASVAPEGYYLPSGPMSAGDVMGDRQRGSGDTTFVNITGTKVEIKADTPERARTAGDSARDALSSQRIRNNQPRGI